MMLVRSAGLRLGAALSFVALTTAYVNARPQNPPPATPAVQPEAPEPAPAPCPPSWLGLLGIYGSGPEVIMILERDGALEAGVQRGHFYALESLGGDRFRFGPAARYTGRELAFNRDASGKATSVRLDQSLVPRDVGSDGVVPRAGAGIDVDALVRAAQAAAPPNEPTAPLASDLVEVTTLDPSIRVDLRYAGAANVLGRALLKTSRAFLQRPAAEALVRAHRALAANGYGLGVLDAYRPWWVTKVVSDAASPDARRFLADPAEGSGYNRGTTVDVGLYRRKDGRVVDLTSVYGEMSLRAYTDFPGGTSEQRWHRDLLLQAMEREDFQSLRTQWWRFDLPEGRKYPVLNLAFEDVASGQRNVPPPGVRE
jgi:D-alanyl-D-alanine dipeptidase